MEIVTLCSFVPIVLAFTETRTGFHVHLKNKWKETQKNYYMWLSLLNCEFANIFLLVFICLRFEFTFYLQLFFILKKKNLLCAILWNFQRPITNYNLSDEITWGYLTKISGFDDLWWSLQLWDNIERNISGKNSVDWSSYIMLNI